MGPSLVMATVLLVAILTLDAAASDDSGIIHRIVRLRKGAVTTVRGQSQWRAEHRHVTAFTEHCSLQQPADDRACAPHASCLLL
jgi:hypothetical protein